MAGGEWRKEERRGGVEERSVGVGRQGVKCAVVRQIGARTSNRLGGGRPRPLASLGGLNRPHWIGRGGFLKGTYSRYSWYLNAMLLSGFPCSFVCFG